MKKISQWILIVGVGLAILWGLVTLSQRSGVQPNLTQATHTIIDVRGRRVTIPRQVKRAYYPYYYQNLLTVAGPRAFERVTASSIFDTANYSGDLYQMLKAKSPGFRQVTDVGSTLKSNFNLEKLIATKPDLVILANYQYEGIGQGNIDRLGELGIPVVFIDYTDLKPAAHYQSTKILGEIFGTQKRAAAVNQNYQDHLNQVALRLKQVKTKKTAYFEQRSAGASYAQYGKAYGSQMLMGVLAEEAGAKNIYASRIKGTGDVNPEFLFQQNPDAIFLDGTNYADSQTAALKIGYGVSAQQTQASLTALINQRPGFRNLRAVKNGQVYAMDNHLMRTMKDYVLVEFIAKQLYPAAFQDIDPEQNLKDFNQTYLPDLVDDSVFLAQWQAGANSQEQN
ncbi:ABC transporter substrate-binding protein [Leuconostocaceae bacterium ESL0723]|nr:ABC transporter substrate-binding protein [Leuconostocaceae bacterium ESL0723]